MTDRKLDKQPGVGKTVDSVPLKFAPGMSRVEFKQYDSSVVDSEPIWVYEFKQIRHRVLDVLAFPKTNPDRQVLICEAIVRWLVMEKKTETLNKKVLEDLKAQRPSFEVMKTDQEWHERMREAQSWCKTLRHLIIETKNQKATWLKLL